MPSVLRRLAGVLRSFQSPEQLLEGLRQAVVLLPGLDSARLVAGGKRIEFAPDRLTVPLEGRNGTLGVLQIAPPPSAAFGVGELQLAGAVADAVSAVVEQALAARGYAGAAGLLSVVLDDLPVGVVCYDESGDRVFANRRAVGMLGGEAPTRWDAVWNAYAPEPRRAVGTDFVRRDGVQVLHVVSRQATGAGAKAIIITDLGAQVAAFGSKLELHLLRSRQERRALSLAVIASAEGSPDAHRFAETLAPHLPSDAEAGPIEAEAAAVVVPGASPVAVLSLVRDHSRREKSSGLRIGVADARDNDTIEVLVSRAVASLQDAGEPLRPILFVADRSPSVADALAVTLRRDCQVTVGSTDARGLHLLEDRPFDGMILELPEPESPGIARWVRSALDLQPGARRFFITDLPGPWDLEQHDLPVAPVFRKPFQVREVRAAIGRAFADPG